MSLNYNYGEHKVHAMLPRTRIIYVRDVDSGRRA